MPPCYDYVCADCGTNFSVSKSYTDTEKSKCPICLSERLINKLNHAPGIIFKGRGFTKSVQENE